MLQSPPHLLGEMGDKMTNEEIMDKLFQKNPEKQKGVVKRKRGYNGGKKLNRDKFAEAMNLVLDGVSTSKAYVKSGVSLPTFLKYANQLYINGYLPPERFEDGEEPMCLVEREISEYEKIGKRLNDVMQRK